MTTLNLLSSITPTGDWLTDSSFPYDMQPYDYSPIKVDVVLDSENPILEITNIPVGAMIANPPLETPPYDSSMIVFYDGSRVCKAIFKFQDDEIVLYEILTPGYVVNISTEYTLDNTSVLVNVYITDIYNTPIDDYIMYFYFDLISVINGIPTDMVSFDVNGVFGSELLLINEIASSYSVVSTDIANRRATIRVDKSIENLAPPLNRLFLRFDKTP